MTGNPLAVVFDAEGLSTQDMQQIARWLNLSETTFVLPPTSSKADYRVRIFTLSGELPFAGHPTLGTCHAWLANGGKPRDDKQVIQECGVGLIPIRREGDRLAFAAPPLVRSGPLEEERVTEIAGVLGIDRSAIVDAQWVDNGPGWMAVMLKSAEDVLAVQPRGSHPTHIKIGVVGAYPAGSEMAYEVRALLTNQHRTMMEDPVTGSLNASVAQWLLRAGRVKAPYVASQGARVGRAGRIYVDRDAEGQVWIGGKVTTLVSGELTMTLPDWR